MLQIIEYLVQYKVRFGTVVLACDYTGHKGKEKGN